MKKRCLCVYKYPLIALIRCEKTQKKCLSVKNAQSTGCVLLTLIVNWPVFITSVFGAGFRCRLFGIPVSFTTCSGIVRWKFLCSSLNALPLFVVRSLVGCRGGLFCPLCTIVVFVLQLLCCKGMLETKMPAVSLQ